MDARNDRMDAGSSKMQAPLAPCGLLHRCVEETGAGGDPSIIQANLKMDPRLRGDD